MSAKGESVRELLGMSEQLQDTLHSLAKEKDLLATSLRDEAGYTRQLEKEKVGEREGGVRRSAVE